MSNNFLEFDILNSNHEKEGDDLIEIKIGEECIVDFNYTNFFIQSRYIRNKYKYPEGIENNSIQKEMDTIGKILHISKESLKIYIDLVQKGKVLIPFDQFNIIYKLCEYFDIPKFINELNKLCAKNLLQNVDFAIQQIHDSNSINCDFTTNFVAQIEDFLSTRINECFENMKFGDLSISLIYRVIVKSNKENLDSNLLFDFIAKCPNNRFVLLKFVELNRLKEGKIKELLTLIESQDDTMKNIFIDHIRFDIKYMKKIIMNDEKLEQMSKIFEQKNHELEENNEKLEKMSKILEQKNHELEENNEKLEKMKNEMNKNANEISKIKSEIEQKNHEIEHKNHEIEQMKNEINKTKIEFDKIKAELEKMKNQFNRRKSSNEQFALVCGYDYYSSILEKPNNNHQGTPCVYPPMKAPFDPSMLLSYSAIYRHSVLVTLDHKLQAAGLNDNFIIGNSLPKETITHLTEYSIKDSNGCQISPISAVCLYEGTLYMYSKSGCNKNHLVLFHRKFENNQVFINIGNKNPVALFGGYYYAVVICDEGELIFINPNAIKNPNELFTEASSLNGKKIVSVAFVKDSLIVLSSNGKVFKSPIRNTSNDTSFSIVEELKSHEIICISGIHEHCFAVSKESIVFGFGSNSGGKLGLSIDKNNSSQFIEIQSLRESKIIAAYAGYYHSLFQTDEGKLYSCGHNFYGQLLLSSGPSDDDICSPVETTITKGATFCIAGDGISIVFIGDEPPPNIPNRRIQ